MKHNKTKAADIKVIEAPAIETVKAPKGKKTLTRKPENKAKAEEQKKALNDANALSTVKKITDRKDLKYKYPKTAADLQSRKKFRAEVRRKLKALEKEIFRLTQSNLKEDSEMLDVKTSQYEEYTKKVLAK